MTRSEAEMAYKLATAKLDGKPTPEEVDACLAELKAAAEAGYAPAQYACYELLDFHYGDMPGGLPYLIMAAEQGYTDALMDLRELYAGDEAVRRRVSELLTGEQVAAFGLKEGNFFSKFCTHRDGENSPLGRAIGFVFCLVMAGVVLSKLLPPLQAWLGGEALPLDEWKMLSVLGGVCIFMLTFFAVLLLDWKAPSSAGDHPLTLAAFGLFLAYLTAVTLAWGWHDYSHSSRTEEQWWLSSALLGGVGLAAGVATLMTASATLKAMAKRAARG